jgi:hypothetical protein
MYRLSISLFLTAILFVSCKNNDDTCSVGEGQDPDNFYALTVGNSWTFEYFRRIGTSEDFESLNAFDEVEITGNTEINGKNYFVFQTTTSGNDGAPPYVPENGVANLHFRDSLGYLINEAGKKFFSNTNQEQEYFILEHPTFNLFGKLVNGTENVDVEAGVFNALNNEIFAKLPDETIPPGRSNKYYAEEIGQLKETYSAISNPISYGEKRLVSYLVN